MSVLIVGSIAYDTVETPFEKKERVIGGSCIYGAIAASFFSKVSIIGVVGDDFSDCFFKFLNDKNIDTKGVIKEKGKTFFWHGRYSYDMKTRESIKTELNVFADFKPVLEKEHEDIPFLFLANIDPELQLDVLNKKGNTKFVICDTMNYWIENKREKVKEVFKRVDCVILNDEEVREYTGKTDILKASYEIIKDGPNYIIIKKGEHGATLIGKNVYFTLPSYPVYNIKDPTGAGDTFAGAFIGYLAKNNSIETGRIKKAIAYGNIVASFTIEDFSIVVSTLSLLNAYISISNCNLFLIITFLAPLTPIIHTISFILVKTTLYFII